jgi:hypothetical protein
MGCEENLSFNNLKYFLQSMGKLLSYVPGDPLLKLRAFKPGDTNVSIALACVISKIRFLNLVPEVNLHVKWKSCNEEKTLLSTCG